MYSKIQTAFPPFFLGDNKGGALPFKLAKNDLIAELKLSHNVGGVSKLRSEQQKMHEEQERAEYRRFLAQFTMENFLEKVSLLCIFVHICNVVKSNKIGT